MSKNKVRYTAIDHNCKEIYSGSCQQEALKQLRAAGGGKLYYFGLFMADYAPGKGLYHGK